MSKVLNFGKLLVIAALMFLAYSCDEGSVLLPTVVPNNTINGTITFVDTGFAEGNGTYLIAVYPTSSWPPAGPPSAYDTIDVQRVNNSWQTRYAYTIPGVVNGSYYVSVGYRYNTPGSPSPVMGIYGCDTSHSASCLLTPTRTAVINNNAGVDSISFLSWADTTRKLY